MREQPSDFLLVEILARDTGDEDCVCLGRSGMYWVDKVLLSLNDKVAQKIYTKKDLVRTIHTHAKGNCTRKEIYEDDMCRVSLGWCDISIGELVEAFETVRPSSSMNGE